MKKTFKKNIPAKIQKKMEDIGEFRYKERLIKFLHYLFQDFDVKLVAIYGSVTRGDDFYNSDLDVFLVASDFPKRIFDRLDSLNGYMIPLDFKAHLVEEFHSMVDEWHLTVLEVLNDGWILYDPEKIGEEAKKKFDFLVKEQKLIRHSNYWEIRT